MPQESFMTSKAPRITVVSCNGDLVVRTWGETAVKVAGDAYQVDQNDDHLSITAPGGLKLNVPENSTLAIQTVSGDTSVKYVMGGVSIQEGHGDVIFHSLAEAKINVVHGDLSTKNIDETVSVETVHGDMIVRRIGHLHVGTIDGDLSARYITGDVNLSEVKGDTRLDTVNGEVTITKSERDVILSNLGGKTVVTYAHGDIRLKTSLSAADHSFTAERDIILRWPADAAINLSATAPQIKNRLPLEHVKESDNTLTGSLGDGKTNVTLTANGRIILKEDQVIDARWELPDENEMNFDFSFDFENIGAQIQQRIQSEISKFSTDFDQYLGPEFSQKLTEKINQKVEKAASKAEQAAARAAERAERAAERARRQAEQQIRRTPGRPPGSSKKSEPTPASPEEQLKILKMVEQGLITPDEAAALLEALS